MMSLSRTPGPLKRCSVWFFCLLAAGIAADAKGQGQVEAQRSLALLTARRLVGELRDRLPESPIDSAALERDMRENPGQNIKIADSRRRLRSIVECAIKAEYEAEVRRILTTLDAARPDGTPTLFSDTDRLDLLGCPATKIERCLKTRFEPVFERVRQQECERIWVNLQKRIRPSLEQVDQAATDRGSVESELTKRLAREQRAPVFEELESRLTQDVVKPILDDALGQRELQHRLLRDATAGENVLPRDIEAALPGFVNRELSASRERLNSSGKTKQRADYYTYDLFPSVRKSVPQRALELARTRFLAALAELRPEIDPKRLREIMVANPKDHVPVEQSRRLCVLALESEVVRAIVMAYVMTARNVRSDEVQGFVDSLLVSDASVRRAVEEACERNLEESYKEVRAGLVAEQLQSVFEPVEKMTWLPPPGVVEQFVHTRDLEHWDWLALPGIAVGAFDTQTIFSENQDRVRKFCESRLSDGRKAFLEQMKLVESSAQEVERSLLAEESLPTEAELISRLTEAVLSEWRVGKHKDRYPDLFGRAKADLVLRAKAMLPRAMERRREQVEAALRRQREADSERAADSNGSGERDRAKGAESSGPGGKARGGAGQAGGGSGAGGAGEGAGLGAGAADQRKADVVIDIRRQNSIHDIEVRFNTMPIGPIDVHLEHPLPARAVLRTQLREKLNPAITQWVASIRNTARDRSRYVFVRVHDDATPYMVVFELRMLVVDAVQHVESDGPTVLWCDGLVGALNDKNLGDIDNWFFRNSRSLTDR